MTFISHLLYQTQGRTRNLKEKHIVSSERKVVWSWTKLVNQGNIVAAAKKMTKFNQTFYLQLVHARVHFFFEKWRLGNFATQSFALKLTHPDFLLYYIFQNYHLLALCLFFVSNNWYANYSIGESDQNFLLRRARNELRSLATGIYNWTEPLSKVAP